MSTSSILNNTVLNTDDEVSMFLYALSDVEENLANTGFKQYKVETKIKVHSDISEKELLQIVEEFEDVAWENHMDITQPKVKITEVKQ